MPRTRLTILAVLLVLAGCNESPTARTHDPTLRMATSLDPVPVDPGFEIGGGASVAAGRGRITMSGKFDVSCSSHTIDAALAERSGTLEVTITRKPETDEGCRTAAGRYSYSAAITGLRGGRYTVLVRHVGEADLANGIYQEQPNVRVD